MEVPPPSDQGGGEENQPEPYSSDPSTGPGTGAEEGGSASQAGTHTGRTCFQCRKSKVRGFCRMSQGTTTSD